MKKGWTEVTLGDACFLEKGESPTLKTEPGKYPLVVTAAFRRNSNKYQFTKPSVCIPVVSSTGHGNAAIHRIHYEEGKFALANLLVAATPKNDSFLSAKFLWRYLNAMKDRQLVPLMQGTANVTLKLSDLLDVRIPVPPLSEQQRIVAHLDAVEERLQRVQTLREEQEQELLAALRSAFHKIEATAEWIEMGEIAPLVRRPVEIEPDGRYPELGVRSFGRGAFHKPDVLGIETTKRLFEIHEGDLLFSNVFAWEGAIAIAQREDHGRFGSHRFMSCVCERDRVLPELLQFYFLTAAGLEKIGQASPGGAGRNRTLGITKLEKIKVPIPPMKLQREFLKLLNLQKTIKAESDKSTQHREALLPSLLDRIFGENCKKS